MPKKILFSYFALFLFEMLKAHVKEIEVFRISLLKLFKQILSDFDIFALV